MVSDAERYLISGPQYDQMVEAGILGPDDRVELLNGVIVRMAAQGPGHYPAIDQIQRDFGPLWLSGQVGFHSQAPIRLPGDQRPEPDLVLVRPRGKAYYDRHLPEPEDILLVIEVADTSVERDLQKARIYAAAGIPEYWLVNLAASPARVTVHRDPGPDGYQSVQIVRAGEPLTALAFPDVIVDTVALLR